MPVISRRFADELTAKEMRDAYLDEKTRAKVALQVTEIRTQRGLSQAELGDRMDKPQSNIARLEDRDVARYTLTTLLELASAYDCGLVVEFVPYAEFLRRTHDLSPARLRVPTFDRASLEPLCRDITDVTIAPPERPQTQTGPSSPAAIERARAAWSGISWGTQMTWPQAEVEKVIAAFAAAIDAAATTPTPDQGALERAHEIALRIYPNRNSAHHQHLANLILDGLTAAEAEARAAERIATIEECAQWIRGAKGGWPTGAGDSDEWTLDDVANELERALATPAQSPGQKIIAGLEEALAHAKGETAVLYHCGHWHNNFKEALECVSPRPAQSETR